MSEEKDCKEEMDRLGGEGQLLVRSSLTNLVMFGGILQQAYGLSGGEEKVFDQWVFGHYGKTFSRIAYRLMNCHRTFAGHFELLPVVTSDTLLAIVGEENPPEKVMEIVKAEKVDLNGDGELKKLQALSKKDISKLNHMNKKLIGIIDEKKEEIDALEQEVEDLKTKLARAGGSPEADELRNLLKRKDAEIAKLCAKERNNKKKNNKKVIAYVRTKLANFFLDEDVDSLTEISGIITNEERDLIRSSIETLEQQLRQFKSKVGVS